jgi:hypothetical protein
MALNVDLTERYPNTRQRQVKLIKKIADRIPFAIDYFLSGCKVNTIGNRLIFSSIPSLIMLIIRRHISFIRFIIWYSYVVEDVRKAKVDQSHQATSEEIA